MDTKEIYDLLKLRFGEAKCELNFTNNYELLVAVILSARCSDKRVNLVTPKLFEKYKTPFDLARADTQDVEKLIYSCGFYKNKARNLASMARDLVEKYGGEVPNTFDDLVKLSGVGRKTANVVEAVGFQKDAFAVDTHVFRVSKRLGLMNETTPEKCEKAMKKVVPKELWRDMHHLFVLFGRYICKSRNPNCEGCEFREICKDKTLDKK